MAEVIPPASTPKPITARRGSELLEPGRGSASLFLSFLSLFAGDGVTPGLPAATFLVPAVVGASAPAEENAAAAGAGLGPWVCGGCAHSSATKRQITPTIRNCQ